jgi:2-dehydropantoate 2-reductase
LAHRLLFDMDYYLNGRGRARMNIAILGAGGVGGYFGGILARAGNRVAMLARGAHLEALRARGLEVRAPEGTFTVAVEAVDDADELQGIELAVVAVKSYSLAEIAPAARLLAERGAVVLPLLNGVEAADRLIAAGVPGEEVLGGLAEISAVRTGPGTVERRSPFQRIVAGERAGGTSERVERIAAAFREAGAEARASAGITVDLWRKFAFITTMSAACGLARAPIGPVREAPLGNLLIERALREVAAVARALGVALPAEMEAGILAAIGSMPEAMKPSFLLDLESGGPTELDDLSGAVSRLGRQTGVETPVHDVATAALSAGRMG